MYREQVPSYKHLDEGRFVLECILAGNLQAFTTCRPQRFHVQDPLDCPLHVFSCFLLQNKLFIPSSM